MSKGKILRIQLEYNPNSSSMNMGGLDLLLYVFLAVPVGAGIGYLATRPAIQAQYKIPAKLNQEREMALNFLIEKKRKEYYQELKKAKPIQITVKSGTDLKNIVKMVESGQIKVTNITVTEKK
jgi:flagellar biosynthesis protein FliP